MDNFQNPAMQQFQQQMQPVQLPPTMMQQQIAQKKRDITADVMELSEVVRDTSGRIRVIEERYSNLRKILQVNEQNTLKISRDLKSEVKMLSDEVIEIKTLLSDMKEELKLVISELKVSAKKEDVTVLEKYINLWEPLNFVTQRDVDSIVRRAVENALQQNNAK